MKTILELDVYIKQMIVEKQDSLQNIFKFIYYVLNTGNQTKF